MRPARLVPRWGEFADALEDVRQEQWRSVLHAADNHDREVGDQHQPAHAAARPGNTAASSQRLNTEPVPRRSAARKPT
jgi:hypothetical protein